MAVKINLMPQKVGVAIEANAKMPFYSLIIIIVFFLCVFIFSGIYLYNNIILKKQLDIINENNSEIQENISKAISQEESATVISAISKGKSIRSILSSHVYETKIYDLLESVTIKGVSYNDFSEKESKENIISVSINGKAESFNALAKQLMILKKTSEIKDIVFTDATMEKDAKVSFSYSLSFDSKLLNIKPDIILSGPSVLTISKGNEYLELGAIATDGLDGKIGVKISGSVNTGTPGIYVLSYSAVNSVGNTATVTRTIEVAE